MSHAPHDEFLQILVLGPAGPARRRLERTLRRLGHEALPTEAAPWADLTRGQVVVLDARGPGGDWRMVAGELLTDPRPLVVVTDDARELSSLFHRPATALALTGEERDAGYAMALSLCAATLAHAEAGPFPTAAGARSTSGLAAAAA
jgi:hypothetical protein